MGLLDYCKAHNEIVLYGVGHRGKELYEMLKICRIPVSNFIVSKIEKDIEFDGIPILEFDKWYSHHFFDKGCGLIVAVSDEIADPIKKKISRAGVTDWFYAGDYDTFRAFRREAYPVDEHRFVHSVQPVSRCFGVNRGRSIARYYLEKFLSEEARKLCNVSTITEVGENLYSKMYFPNADCDIIYYNQGTDLTKPSTLNKEKYDCFICTQVFNFIFDVKAAIKGAFYLLKSRGTLLGSVAGNISPVSQTDMDSYGHYWGFTYLGIERLIEEAFGEGNVTVVPLGNVLSATAYTQGMCFEDIVDKKLLDYNDKNYPIVIGFVAHKASD